MKLFSLFALALFGVAFGEDVSSINLEKKVTVDGNCTCTETDPAELNKPEEIKKGDGVSIASTCGEDCFELVFLVDGRTSNIGDINGLKANDVWDVVQEWISRVTTQVIDSSGKNSDNFLVVIQYANLRKVTLASEMNKEEISQQITDMQQEYSDQNVKPEESPKLIKQGIESLLNYLDFMAGGKNNTLVDIQNNEWEEYRQRTNSNCKSVLTTFTHNYLNMLGEDLSEEMWDKIQDYFNRTDVVTVSYRPEGTYGSEHNPFVSQNGITYEYPDYTSMISSVSEVARHICDPHPNIVSSCDIELVFLVDASYCDCDNSEKIYNNIRRFINEVSDSYRTDKQLMLGHGLLLGFQSFYKKEKDGQLEFDNMFDVTEYANLAHPTTSLDNFRQAVNKFNQNRQPYSDLTMPTEQKPEIHLSEILENANQRFFTDNSQSDRPSTKILVVLKGENPGSEIDLQQALQSQVVALRQKYDHNISIVTLPVKNDPDSVDNSEAHMLNAVSSVPTAFTSVSALDQNYEYDASITATFETLLGKIETCSDNDYPSGIIQTKQNKNGYKTEYKCTCPVKVDISGEGGCVIGSQGDQGQRGDIGDVGLEGHNGAPGFDGIDGQQGKTGEQGPTGPQGQKGRKGVQGLHGTPGRSGPNGRTGNRGLPGKRGSHSVQSWESIFDLVNENCNCGGSCGDRSSDWMMGAMINPFEFETTYDSVIKQLDEENANDDKSEASEDSDNSADMLLSEEDRAWIEAQNFW